MLRISHQNTIKHIENFFFKKGIYSKSELELFENLRFCREQYSYHLPLSGVNFKNGRFSEKTLMQETTRALIPILNITNVMSYLSHFAWKKKINKMPDECDEKSDKANEMFKKAITHESHNGHAIGADNADYDRLEYIINIMSSPCPIGWFINEKICEDLGCYWEPVEETGGFDADQITSFLSFM